jgi:3-phenylpropionate/trans-cinnamate dioxygenase ferredoxin reductase component
MSIHPPNPDALNALDAGSTVAIVGAGLAGLRTAEALRRRGFAGRVLLFGAEPHPPYERPVLSKDFLTGPVTDLPVLTVRPDVSAESIDIRTGTAAAGLDLSQRVLHLADGTQVRYDRLAIATGAHSRRLPGLPEGLHRIRGYEDALRLRGALAGGGEVVIIGGGFIGCEVAASVRALGSPVTVVEALGDPLARVLGPAVARRITRLHENHGVRIVGGSPVREVSGMPGQWRVRLDSGQDLDAAVVVEAVGAVPSTAWLADSGLDLANGVLCDATGQTSAAGVYALGDAACWLDPCTGGHHRREHWTAAVEQAHIVASNLLAAPDEQQLYSGLPYVWSDQYGVRIQTLGTVAPDVTVELLQDDDNRMLALYTAASQVTGVAAMNNARAITRMRPLLERGADVGAVRALLETLPTR